MHHQDEPLVLPNAWDYTSAVALHAAGFLAIGTTSLGVAAAHGLPDGVGLAGRQAVALATLLEDLPCPVTVDLESGFGQDPAELVARLDAAGVNLEDGRPHGLATPEEQARVISRVKERAPGVFLNARETVLRHGGDLVFAGTNARVRQPPASSGAQAACFLQLHRRGPST